MRFRPGRLDRGTWLTVLAVPVLCGVVHVLHQRQGGDLSIQSELNLRFANRPSLAIALERYPKLRPPLYPLLLWGAARTGVPFELVNEGLMDLTLLGLFLVVRRTRPSIHPVWPTAAYALSHFNYVNLQQLTAEALFVPLLLAVLFFLWRYHGSGSLGDLALLAAALSPFCLTRYFALSLAVPLVLVNVLLLSRAGPRRRLLHAGLLVASLLPIALWMGYAYRQTGYWTGAERASDRHLPEAVRHWSELTTFPANLRLMGRTVLVDFFSPSVYAAHSVVTHPHAPSPLEWVALAAGAVAAGGIAVAGLRARRQPTPSGSFAARIRRGMAASPAPLATEFLAAYLVLTLAIWTAGNNDPLYTRFLFPCYVLMFVVALPLYDWVKAQTASRWVRLPLLILFAAFLAAQLARDWRAEALPIRFME